MNKILIIIGTFFIFLLCSCSTDLDINAEWEDIPVVFCILDESKEYQYVKVNKTFLGAQPASVMAQYSDSLFYDKVEVHLYEYDGDNILNRIIFNKTDTIPKEYGYFANDRNIVYVSDYKLKSNYLYQLEVIIDNGRKIAESEKIELIKNANIVRPGLFPPTIDIHNYNGSYNYSYQPGINSKVSQLTVIFHYIEVDISNKNAKDTTYHSIEWKQSINVIPDNRILDNILIEASFNILSFYNLLETNIPKADENIKRYVRMPNSLSFVLSSANSDYRTYMEISSPSHGIIQEKPSFTNLKNAVGLFASRYNTVKKINLAGRSLDSISRGIYTNHLGFQGRYSDYYMSNMN